MKVSDSSSKTSFDIAALIPNQSEENNESIQVVVVLKTAFWKVPYEDYKSSPRRPCRSWHLVRH